MVKIIHFVHHSDSRVNKRKSTERTRSFTQPHAQGKERFGTQRVKHPTVTTLVTTMTEDHICLRFRIESAGSQSTSRHDETIDEDEHLLFGSTKHRANRCHHLKTTKVTNDVGC